MPPKSPRGKKGKDKKKKGKKEEVFSNVDKAFCHLTITDLNRKLAHLRSYLNELEEQNIALKKDNEQVTDRKDVADFLQGKLDQKEKEFKLLEKEFEHISQLREQENAEFQMRIKDLEDLNKAMQEQLIFEIKLLQSKLNCLEEFRFNRELLLSKLEEAEDAVTKKDSDNRQAIFAMEQKALIEKDNLKKSIEMQLLQLAEDFAKSNEIKASGYTRRLIRENIALHKEIDILIEAHLKMKAQYDEYVFRNKVILQNYSSLEDTNHTLMFNCQAQIEIIEKITEKCEMFIKKYNEAAKKRNYYELILEQTDCKRFNYKRVTEKLQRLRTEIDDLQLENSRLNSLQAKQENEIKILRDNASELKKTIEIFVGLKKPSIPSCRFTAEEEEFRYEECEAMLRAENRQSLLTKILDIINSVQQPEEAVICTPQDSLESLYHPGQIGFIPGEEPQENLLDLLTVEKPVDTDTKSQSRSLFGSFHIDNSRIPDACQMDGNSIEDLEMGSLFIASSSKSEEKVEIEEEPMEYDDAGSSSDQQDQTFIVCDKPEDEKEKQPVDPLKPVVIEKAETSETDEADMDKPSEMLEKPDQDGAEGQGEEADGEEEDEGAPGERNEDEFPPFFFY